MMTRRMTCFTAAIGTIAFVGTAGLVQNATAQTAPIVEPQPYGVAPYASGSWWQYRGGPKSDTTTQVYNNALPAPDVYGIDEPNLTVPR